MSGTRTFVVSIALVILFSLACYTFLNESISANNPTSSYLNDSNVANSTIQLKSIIEDFNETTNNARNVLERAQPSPVYIFLIIIEALTIPKDMLVFIVKGLVFFSGTMFTQLTGVSGGLSIVFTVIGGVLIITAVFYIIKTLRSGESER